MLLTPYGLHAADGYFFEKKKSIYNLKYNRTVMESLKNTVLL